MLKDTAAFNPDFINSIEYKTFLTAQRSLLGV